jgi:hypothetical protein
MTDTELLQGGKELLCIINHAYFGSDLTVVTDYKRALKIAIKHGVVNLFYLGVKDDENCPNEVKAFAKKRYDANVSQQLAQNYYIEQIYGEFDKQGIKYMPLKGYYIRSLYKSEDMRTSCDIDFYFDKTKEEEVAKILTDLGLELVLRGFHHINFEKYPVTVEAHHTLDCSVDTEGLKKADKRFETFFLLKIEFTQFGIAKVNHAPNLYITNL